MLSDFVFHKICNIGSVIPCFLALDKIIYRKVYFYLVVNTESCIFVSYKNKETMKTYKAIITEASAQKGQIVANTKSPSQYKGMTKEQFTEATKSISVYTIEIVEM